MKIRFLFVTFSLIFALLPSVFADMREWTSATDPNKKFKGKLLQSNGELAQIQLPNGQSINVELVKLSEKDKIFVKTGKEPVPKKVEVPSAKPEDAILSFVFDESPDQVLSG